MFLVVIKKGIQTLGVLHSISINIFWSTAYLDKHQCLPSHQMRIHYSAEYLTQCHTFICITTQQGWFMKSSPVTCMQKALFAMERCTSSKTSEREIYASQLLRDERIQRVERERTGCVFYFIHFMLLSFGATAALRRMMDYALLVNIPSLIFLFSMHIRRRRRHASRKTLRDAVSWVCAWCAYLYLHIYISLNTHLQNMKNDLCYCILITKQKGPLSWLGESTHRSSRSTKRWERENELNTHSINTMPVE
jgi:hypothetical protein